MNKYSLSRGPRLITGQTQLLLKAALTTFIAALSAICSADNPLVSHVYTADPAARVIDGRIYVITTHDQDDQSDYSQLHDYYMFSSDDMVNWRDHGIVFDVNSDSSWASLAYAPDMIERNGKYYLYYPNGANNIGVAVSDNPDGPFTDPLGRPLVDRNTPNANVDWVFDPGVFIDDDGQAYLYFGGGGPGNARVIRLNDDMISTEGAAITLDVPNFFEALYMHKRNGIYYLTYSTESSAGLTIDYMTSDNPISGFQHRGTILENPWENNNNNNHQSILEYNDQWYIFYHNRAVANERGAGTYQRSINVDRLYYNSDGTIQPVNAGPAGVASLANEDAFDLIQAETIDSESGIETENSTQGTLNVIMDYGDWIKISNVDFGSGAGEFEANVAVSGSTSLDIILDNVNDQPVGTLQVANTGGYQSWQVQSTALDSITGVHDLFLRANGRVNLDWYRFNEGTGNDDDDDDDNDNGNSTLEVELESLSEQSGFGPFTVQADAGASGGQSIVWPNNGNQAVASPSDSQSGQVAIGFSLSEPADVQFQIAANLPNADDDSFYYKLDSGAWTTQNNSVTEGWASLTPATFSNVAAGDHTLRILRREDGARLDKVTLTASAGEITGANVSTPPSGDTITCTTGNVNSWGSGFTLGDFTVTNTSTSSVSGWSVALTFDQPVTITNSWGATFSGSGSSFTGTNVGYNGSLAPGQSASFGLQGTSAGDIGTPTCTAN